MGDEYGYFTLGERAVGAGVGRYVEVDREIAPIEFVPGLVFRPVLGDRVMVNFVRWEPGVEAPVHAHDEEQVTVVLEGEFEFDLDGDRRVLGPGQAVHVPPGVPHGARTLGARCFQVDVFAPPRQALLRLLERGAGE